MRKPSSQDFNSMRKWFGIWALRYSVLQIILGIAAMSLSDEPKDFLIVLMIVNAITSHIHLWPAIRATLVANGETWKIKFSFYFKLFLYSYPSVLVVFPSSQSPGDFNKLFLVILLGPPVILFEAYFKLKKGTE